VGEWRQAIRERVAALGLAPAREAEIVEELSTYLDDRFREYRSGGASEAEARQQVHAELEAGRALTDALRDVERRASREPVALGSPRGRWIGGVWHDVRYGVRSLRTSAGLTAVAVLTLALGVGANTAIFQLLNAVTLRALPVRDPQALVEIRIAEFRHATGNFTGRHARLTYALWQQVQAHQDSFAGVFAWGTGQLNLTTGGAARYANGLWVSGDFFNVLGVTPAVGRMLNAADDQQGCGSPVAVLSYAFWQREYGGNPGVIGTTIALSGHPFEIVGVTPPAFFGVEVGWRFDVAAPICAQPIVRGTRDSIEKPYYWWLAAMGRLKPSVSTPQAAAALQGPSPSMFRETLPSTYQPEDAKAYLGFRLSAFPATTGISPLRTTYEAPLWILMAMTGGVLVVACANLANLLLARASAREREIAIRLALGASRTRLIRQLLIESLLLAAAGATAGVFIAKALSAVLVAFLDTEGNPLFLAVPTDWKVLAFTGGLALVTCLLFGLMPALRASAVTPGAVMKGQGRGLTAGRQKFGLRRALVVAQVGLSLVLVVGALLFVRTFGNLMTLDPGFRPEGVLVTRMDLRPLGLPIDKRQAVHRDLVGRLRVLPGVVAAAEGAIVPVTGEVWNERVKLGASPTSVGLTNVNLVTPGYLQTMATPLVMGRDFSEADTESSPRAAIVNETFRRTYESGVDPLGRTFRFEVGPGEKETTYQIVGVMKDTKYSDLRETLSPIVLIDQAQVDEPDVFLTAFARSNLETGSLAAGIARAVKEVSPRIALEFSPLKTTIRESLVLERLMASLSGFFGAVAGILAVIGLYGVLSYSVSTRRNEIGIRMALGADRGRVIRMIVREASWLLVVGIALGFGLTLAAGRTAATLLFGLTPTDPPTLIVAVAGLALVALAASVLPARRASRLDPVRALRDD
jgi:putative ABC transport system permease protein